MTSDCLGHKSWSKSAVHNETSPLMPRKTGPVLLLILHIPSYIFIQYNRDPCSSWQGSLSPGRRQDFVPLFYKRLLIPTAPLLSSKASRRCILISFLYYRGSCLIALWELGGDEEHSEAWRIRASIFTDRSYGSGISWG